MFLIKLISRNRSEGYKRIFASIKQSRNCIIQQNQINLGYVQKQLFGNMNYKFCQLKEEVKNKDKQTLNEFYSHNQILVEQGKYEEAIKNWQTNKQDEQIKGISSEECDFQIAKIYLQKGDIQQSMQLFKDYLTVIEKTGQYDQQSIAEEMHEIAQQYQLESHYEEAESFYELSLKQNKNNVDIHTGYVDNLIRNMNKNDKAIDHIYKIINHNKFYTPLLFSLLGEAYYNKSQYKQSIDYYLKYLEELLRNVSITNQTQDQALLQNLQQQNIEIATIYLKVASSYYFEKNYQKSLEYYLKNYEFQLSHQMEVSHQMYLNIAELHLKEQNIEQSILFLQKGENLYPENFQFAFVQGMIYLNLRDSAKAKEQFEKVIKINPKHLDSYKQLGLLLLKESKYEEAEEMFLKCLSIYHNDTDALYYMAYILQYHHLSPQDALICYQLCLDVNEELPHPLMQMAIIHYDLQNHQLSLDYITKAHQADPNSKQIALLYSQISNKQKIHF